MHSVETRLLPKLHHFVKLITLSTNNNNKSLDSSWKGGKKLIINKSLEDTYARLWMCACEWLVSLKKYPITKKSKTNDVFGYVNKICSQDNMLISIHSTHIFKNIKKWFFDAHAFLMAILLVRYILLFMRRYYCLFDYLWCVYGHLNNH